MKEIPLKNGMNLLVDDEDYEVVARFPWLYTLGDHNNPRIISTIPIGRLVMDVPLGKIVDHINGNVLDNRRENLRVVNNAQNAWNSKLQSCNTSGYKGVHWDKTVGEWRARIGFHYRRIELGTYDTPEEAAGAYNYAAKLYHGEYARLNPGVDDVVVPLRDDGLNRNNTSGYTGVRQISERGWGAYLTKNRKQIYVGTFSTPEEAVKARAKFIKEMDDDIPTPRT